MLLEAGATPRSARAGAPARALRRSALEGEGINLLVDAGRLFAVVPTDAVAFSPDTPPGVVCVSGRLVFVSPQLSETQVIEAFSLR